MYTLGIPNRQKRRTLGYLNQKWIEFKEYPSMEGFFEVRFPGLDEEGFRDISNKLKSQGVTLIGADSQLTEKKIMKLTDLITEDFSKNLDESDSDSIIDSLKNMLQQAQEQLKKLSGDLQTSEREAVSSRKRTEVEKFKTRLKEQELDATHSNKLSANKLGNAVKLESEKLRLRSQSQLDKEKLQKGNK